MGGNLLYIEDIHDISFGVNTTGTDCLNICILMKIKLQRMAIFKMKIQASACLEKEKRESIHFFDVINRLVCLNQAP